MYTEGETDTLPPAFDSLQVRRLLWKEYGVQLPDFGPDDIMDALYLRNVENKREQREQTRSEQKRLQQEAMNRGR